MSQRETCRRGTAGGTRLARKIDGDDGSLVTSPHISIYSSTSPHYVENSIPT